MQATEVDGSLERTILVAMMASPSVLGRIAAKWDGRLFRSREANSVAALCVDFWKKHGKEQGVAPRKAVGTLYESWASSCRDERHTEAVGVLLAGIVPTSFKQVAKSLNPDHIVDLAGKHFRTVRQENLKEDIEGALEARDQERVDQLVNEYRKLEMGVGAGINLFNEEEEISSLFSEENTDVLITYPGPLGEFFGADLSRESFVVFLGTAKSTKSFWLQDISWNALRGRKKVAYFECGDLSKKQVEMRFMVRAAGHPSRTTNTKPPWWPCMVNVPKSITVELDPKSQRRRAVVESEPREFTGPLDKETAWEACERLRKTMLRSKRPFFKLSVHPTSSLTYDAMRDMLDSYAVDGWYPDVIVVDYVDIMAHHGKYIDERHAINTLWSQLRRLSLELHCLVVTATQADADAYGKETMGRGNFSGDRRKNDHPTAMYGVNMTDDEREMGVCRLNPIVRREGGYVSKRCVHVAQCLPLGRPAVLSSF